jgi:hypothetical protein
MPERISFITNGLMEICCDKVPKGLTPKATAIYDGTTDRLPAYSRHDPYLIQAVEDLGSLANGLFTRLELFIAPDDMDYFIDSYDGVETIRQRVAVSLKRPNADR